MAVSGVTLNISGATIPSPVQLQAAQRVGMARVVRLAEAMAKAAAPVRRGTLQRSIQSDITLAGTQIIGRVYSQRFQARLVEKGVRAHMIVPKRKKILRWRASIVTTPTGRERRFWAFAKKVQHPGLPARPFMEPAGRRAMEEAPAIFQDQIALVMQGHA